MLNISSNSVNKYIKLDQFQSYQLLKRSKIRRRNGIIFIGILTAIIAGMFLPWTQNINSKGYVTTLLPEQRPQAIQSVISGRLEKWYVREGDHVEKGDTIVYISEVKSEYFDPNIIIRTEEQYKAKQQSVLAYEEKIKALQVQYEALQASFYLKREQTQNKILQERNKYSMDSIDLSNYQNNLSIAENQYKRTKELYVQGLKTLTDLQDKEYKQQAAFAKLTNQESKLFNQQNIISNLQLELLAIEQDYADKMAKSQSDLHSAVSAKLESSVEVSKLQSKLSNYTERQKFYYITAAQSGYITQTLKKGLGETIKEGTDIATIMPERYQLAVELYLKPQDIPLLHLGDHVQLRFDGWPALVISGWPEAATGFFKGEIVAIDQFIGSNGYYRIMIRPEESEKLWPEKLSIGTGANAFILLNNVPIWYELWRQLNGFPPDYYQPNKEDKTEVKRKAPLRSFK